MTCKEKLIADHPNLTMAEVEKCMDIECPDTFNYLCEPEYCTGCSPECTKCWNREIPEPPKQEFFNTVTLEFVESTEPKTDDTSEARSLVEEIDILKKTIEEQRIELIRCNAIIQTAEQFANVRLPKVKTDF